MLLLNSTRAFADSSLFLPEMALRTFFSKVRTSFNVRVLIALRRSETRARFSADLWFAN